MKASSQSVSNRERVLLVGVAVKRASRIPGVEAGAAERESLLELDELARSAGAEVTGSLLQIRDAIDPATLVGRGKLEEIKIEAQMRKAPLVVFDRNLTPAQQRNIEKATDCRVIDRTQLILDIFARHARSREDQLQVELAQLNYMLPTPERPRCGDVPAGWQERRHGRHPRASNPTRPDLFLRGSHPEHL